MTFTAYLRAIQRLYAGADRRLVLSRPASETKLSALEKQLGAKLPAALRSAWRAADGGPDYTPVFARPGFLTGYDFLPVAGARDAHAGFRRRAPQYEGYEPPKKRDRRIRPGWFEPGWVPFGAFGGATLVLMVDLSPSAKGVKGQVIAFTHDPDEITWVAPSFADFLARSAKAFAKDSDELLEE